MSDIVAKVAERLKISEEKAKKLRTMAKVAGAASEKEIEAVWAGLQRGEANVALAQAALDHHVQYPQRVDECPVCFATMHPVTLAGNRTANFCPIHNVVMPTTE